MSKLGAQNSNAALNERAVVAIRKNIHGWPAKTQAKVYGVGLMTIYRARWRHTYPFDGEQR